MPLGLPALVIGAFGIGTTESVIMGLLPDAADDFGVSIPTAGFLVTGYALGVMLTGRVVASLAHGAFFGIGSVVAADLVARTRRPTPSR